MYCYGDPAAAEKLLLMKSIELYIRVGAILGITWGQVLQKAGRCPADQR